MGSILSKLKVKKSDGIILQYFLCLAKIDLCIDNNFWRNSTVFLSSALDPDEYFPIDLPPSLSSL